MLQSLSQEEGPHWEAELSSTLLLDFLASKTSRNKGLSFKPVYGILLWPSKLTKTKCLELYLAGIQQMFIKC